MGYRSFGSFVRRLAYTIRRIERAQKSQQAREERADKQTGFTNAHPSYGRSNGIAFEHEVALQLSYLGWRTRLTPTSGDFGADIVATIGRETLVVQCKDWRGPAGISSVQQASYARTHYQAHIAAVIVSAEFTKAAYTAAANANVLLLNQYSLHSSSLDRRQQFSSAAANVTFSKPIEEARKREAIQINEDYSKSNLAKSVEWRRYDLGSKSTSKPPNFPRNSSFRLCPECRTVLTLDWGRECKILCDGCGHQNSFMT